MKTSAIIRIVVWSLVALILIGLLMGGLAVNSFFNFPFDINIPFVCSGNIWNEYADSQYYTAGAGSISSQGIRSIEVDWVDGAVNLVHGSANTLSFDETSRVPIENDTHRLHYYVKNNDTLIIRYCASRARISRNYQKTLTLTIPENLVLDDLTVNGVSSSISIAPLSASITTLNSVSGNIEASGLKAHRLTTDTVSGRVTVSNSDMEEMKANTVSGNISLDPGPNAVSIDTDSVSGDTTVFLHADQGFDAKYSTVSGGFHCDFAVHTQKNRATYLDEKLDIDFDSVSGEVRIQEK